MARAGLSVLLVLAACIRTDSSQCADGTLCAPGTTCASFDDGFRCITADQRAACEGGGATCTSQGGRCREATDGEVCIVAVCGDHSIDTPERCDDGNRVDDDGCSAACDSDETCGNGVVDLHRGEQCDDGAPALSGDGCDATCQTEFRTWRDVTPDPPVRWSFGLAQDPFRGVVMMGGASAETTVLRGSRIPTTIFSDTFRWVDGGAHAGPTANTGPRRTRAATAYDPRTKQVLVYGGFAPGTPSVRRSDLWAWDGARWTVLATTSPPGARSDAAFACSPTRCILVGGLVDGVVNQEQDDFTSATWSWDGTTWTQLAGQPIDFLGRAGAALAYHAQRGVFVLFGGDASLQSAQAETWTMADGADVWVKQFGPAPVAPVGAYPSAAYDAVNQKVVMVSKNPLQTHEPLTATWSGSWQNLGSVFPPYAPANTPAAFAPTVAWDDTRQRIVALARMSATGSLVEFEWSGTAWTRSDIAIVAGTLSQAASYDEGRGEMIIVDDGAGVLAWDGYGLGRRPATTIRRYTRVAYDSACDRTLAFGGLDSANTFAPSRILQQLTPAGWVTLDSEGPPARGEHAMAYDRAGARLVVFGGTTNVSGAVDDDLWVYSGPCGGGAWTPVPRTTPWPAARKNATLTYDRETERLILFGGADASGALLGDTWELVGTTWRQLAPATSPSERARHAAAYDPRRKRIVVFGGRTTDGTTNDVWQLDGDTWSEVSTVVNVNPREGAVLERDRSGFLVTLGGFSQAGTFGASFSRLHSELDVSRSERCVIEVDADGDGLSGCADPDCASRCAPACAYGETCTGASCGDGTCNPVLEDHALCPADC